MSKEGEKFSLHFELEDSKGPENKTKIFFMNDSS